MCTLFISDTVLHALCRKMILRLSFLFVSFDWRGKFMNEFDLIWQLRVSFNGVMLSEKVGTLQNKGLSNFLCCDQEMCCKSAVCVYGKPDERVAFQSKLWRTKFELLSHLSYCDRWTCDLWLKQWANGFVNSCLLFCWFGSCQWYGQFLMFAYPTKSRIFIYFSTHVAFV